MVDDQKLQKFDKRTVPVFVVDKRLGKICRSTNNTVEKSLESLGVVPEKIIKGSGFIIWDILLPSPEECMAIVGRELTMQDLIERSMGEVFEVPSHVTWVI